MTADTEDGGEQGVTQSALVGGVVTLHVPHHGMILGTHKVTGETFVAGHSGHRGAVRRRGGEGFLSAHNQEAKVFVGMVHPEMSVQNVY